MQYDLIVVGSGPSGQKAAIAAAKQNWRVVVVERQRELLGGVSLHTGTIPSKTIREAILHLTGYRQRDVYEESYRRKREITMNDLRRKMVKVAQADWQVIQDQFARNRVTVVCGEAAFVDPHRIEVAGPGGCQTFDAKHILLAPGTRPARPDHIPFNGETVFDSDEILKLATIPRSMIVIGGGVIGLEYAIMFATLGVQVTVIDGRSRLLEFCDHEIVDALLHHARTHGMLFRLGESVTDIHEPKPGLVAVELESGKRLLGETALFSVGRIGDTAALRLSQAGLEADDRGRLKCNEHFQTKVPHIYAVGDVVGFPALASTAMEQGRRAACHMMGREFEPCPHMPYGLFTIPEISMVGQNEEELTKAHVPYEVGIARYSEIARGQIAGDTTGMLKLLFERESRKLLGVHVIGEAATEIIHIGQAVIAHGGTIDYFRDTVFNYPTMAECYKVAALDGLNKLSLWAEVESMATGFLPAMGVECVLRTDKVPSLA
ncbi:MAG: Si-specific NAD(P)(+) transhydrogenase [Pirellulales bacterium]